MDIYPDGSYRHNIYYVDAYAGLRLDILNLLREGEKEPVWSILPGTGIGYMHVFGHDGTPAASLMSTHFSVTGEYRVNSRFSINAEWHCALFPDQFDGRIMGRMQEGKTGIGVGLTCRLGKQGFAGRTGVTVLSDMPQKAAEPTVRIDTVYIEKKEIIRVNENTMGPFVFCAVLFDINSLSPKAGQDLLFRTIAEFLKKNPDKRIRLDAYTDTTGTEKINIAIANGRAAYIKELLVTELGCDASRIEENPLGSAGQPYERNDFNRVVVVTVLGRGDA